MVLLQGREVHREHGARPHQGPQHDARTPRVALSITDPDNPYAHIAVRGKIVRVTEEGADASIDALAKKYLGKDKYPFRRPGEVRVIYEIEPTVRLGDGLSERERALDALSLRAPLSDDEALAIADATSSRRRGELAAAVARPRARVRDALFGRVVTYSPKVFLPLTNLCRNHCDYCSFRRSPGDPGEWTMTPAEIEAQLVARAGARVRRGALLPRRQAGEGLLGVPPHARHPRARRAPSSTCTGPGRWRSRHGLLPHTNAGLLTDEDMTRLKEVNVSLGLMLECASPRLCEPGMPHHRAPDKRPDRRLAMIEAAGRLRIPFTTGILVGIGETRRERVESLLAIRRAHRRHGHVQEVIVQNFRAVPGVPMEHAPEPDDDEVTLAVAMARLILDHDVIAAGARPTSTPRRAEALLASGLNDFGGISPVTPDYINPRHPWPHLDALGDACARAGFALRPRASIYDRYVERPGFLDPRLLAPDARRSQARLASAAQRRVRGGRMTPSEPHASSRASVPADVRRVLERALDGRDLGVDDAVAPLRRARRLAARARGRGRSPPPGAGRRRRRLRRQPQRQLHQRLRQGVPLLRLLAHPAERGGLLPADRGDRAARARGAGVRRDGDLHPGGPRARDRRALLRRPGARAEGGGARRCTCTPSRPRR